MTTDTQQFLFRLFGWMIALSIGGFELVMGGAIFYFGDGEGIRIVQTLATPMLGAFGAAVAFVLGHQILIAKLANAGQLLPSANAQASSGAQQTASASDAADNTLAGVAASVAAPTAANGVL